MYDGIDCGLPNFPVLQMTGGSELFTKTGIHFRDCIVWIPGQLKWKRNNSGA